MLMRSTVVFPAGETLSNSGDCYDAADNAWYQPFGTAPSTHIVKQSHVRLSGIVVNELLCLHTAKKCGNLNVHLQYQHSRWSDAGAGRYARTVGT